MFGLVFYLHPGDPTVVIGYLIWPCDMLYQHTRVVLYMYLEALQSSQERFSSWFFDNANTKYLSE